MVRFLFILIAVYLLYVVIKEWFLGIKQKKQKNFKNEEPMVRDPVCGMFLPGKMAKRLEKDGKVYYFCSDECMKKFFKREEEND